jgi:hypothetical protein
VPGCPRNQRFLNVISSYVDAGIGVCFQPGYPTPDFVWEKVLIMNGLPVTMSSNYNGSDQLIATWFKYT